MARTSNRLTAMTVQKAKEPGRYADGGGLYLQIGPTGGKSWLFRYTRQGKAREMGLGALNVLSLAEAREAAASVRRTLAAGHDPLDVRKAERQQQETQASNGMTFSECASAYIEAHKSGWRNEKHVAQWSSTIKTYAAPIFGTLPVQAINLEMVLKVLEPIWHTKPETAARLRGRIEAVLDWAAVRGHRSSDNPARWKGHLDKLLPPRSKVQSVQHHPALPYEEIGAFMSELRQREEGAARALEFTILTASRTSEALNARWDEFDLNAKVWRIPGKRMKAGKDHRIPLSEAAMTILTRTAEIRQSAFVFPGQRKERPLSNMVFLQLLKRMKRPDLTTHGFRSTFRDWAAERTAFSREVAEMALAHTIGDKVEAAYRRGDLFEKRRELMASWADFCSIGD
ncbi:MAG: integrase arm-type DNA-binding domain-containing protein [Magnetospirillum gryphiswaldense]|uniref:Integrase arm-type DNA-binding domain-containing protein n=1 Tax=Magnetospirillum sulfuroxidans TaxID=611300 RepID=A0ABS5IH99_9PROT|nr:site-specific integrase [Magnetospirillum sulfuroxidans]MBI2240943.1 integrase arm-type DNA-binding domain-containing protein [Magnetospirillum gryphiswaldense]MBR9973572.1 integrase arm-type DNA-binding domain-containing protein [Magnetospirillum sulfuroxidans]